MHWQLATKFAFVQIRFYLSTAHGHFTATLIYTQPFVLFGTLPVNQFASYDQQHLHKLEETGLSKD